MTVTGGLQRQSHEVQWIGIGTLGDNPQDVEGLMDSLRSIEKEWTGIIA